VTATRGGITLSQFIRITPFIALYVVRFTLPISLLVGATFTLGRLVADREVLAMRACGMHFGSIALPLLAIGLVCSIGLYFYNDRILPVCDYARRNVLKSFARDILTLQRGANKSFELPGYNVFCREYDGRTLRGLMIFRDDPELPFEIVAREGNVWLSEDGHYIIIALEDVQITYYGGKDKISYGELVSENYSIFVPMRVRKRNRPGFWTVAQLMRESRHRRKEITGLKVSYKNAKTEEARQQLLLGIGKLSDEKRRIDIEYHRRGADALTPFVFLFVGIPITLLINSRVRLVPSFAALIAVLVTNFGVILVAEPLAESGRLDPWFAMWLGDILTVCVGIFFFWRLLEK
jgi:lipopolysaccharide export LptBFGC system permease protein LptF